MMKKINFLLLLIILFLSFSCSKNEEPILDETPNEPLVLTDAQKYYLEIAFGTEFGNSTDRIKKWDRDLRIFINHNGEDALVEDFDLIIEELNGISNSTKLFKVDRIEMANFAIFLSDAPTYAEYEPSAAGLLDANWGLFWLNWNSGCFINNGSMYVDITRTLEVECQKHLLREELTQSLGLMTDSNAYDDSIFYQPWTCGTTYSDIDKELLDIHLDSRIKGGMTSSEIVELFRAF